MLILEYLHETEMTLFPAAKGRVEVVMKHFYLLALLFFSPLSNAELTCDQWTRAVNTDQKDMVMAMLFSPQALNMDPRQVYSSKIENYISWKGEQQECAANVLHRADLEVKTLETPGEICTYKLVLHRFDNFLVLPTVSDYKIRDLQKSCVAANAAESQTIVQCLSTSCEMVGNALTFPDYTDNCQCKLFDRMIQFEDESANYEDFFNPKSVYKKPDAVVSPFEE